MSIFCDFEVGPKGRRFRRAVDQDKKDIETFSQNQETVELFKDCDIGSLIEMSNLAICMINENKEVTGFIALCDHPNLPSVDPAHWETWIRNMYQKYYLSRNTLFIHFMSCMESVSEYFLEEALVSIFLNDAYLLHIVLVVHGTFSVENTSKCHPWKKRVGRKYRASDGDDLEVGQHLYVALRQDYCPAFKIRHAVEEDNDDVVEILDQQCAQLKELYGNYYVSEIIAGHPESKRKIIVAECQDSVAGVMCLNSDVNYIMLQKTYELSAYHGLVKSSALEVEKNRRTNKLLKTFGDPIMLGQWSPFEHLEKMTATEEEDTHASHENVTRPSKVNFGMQNNLRRSFDQLYRGQRCSDDYSEKLYVNTSPSASQATMYSATLMLEEEPFDYEIVNIDNDLLTVPDVSTIRFEHLLSKKLQTKPASSWKRTRKSLMKRHSLKEKPVSLHYGEPNAFIIELFGFREGIDQRKAFELLEAAFVMMKTYEYCVIRVPCAGKSFPLLEHFCKTFCLMKETKWLLSGSQGRGAGGTHKYSLSPPTGNNHLFVRAEFSDVPQIARLMRNIDGRETIWTVENSIVERKDHQAYVFVSGINIVGVGILEPPEQIDYIRSMFTIDMYQIHKYHVSGSGGNCGYGTLKTVLAYPVFEVHFRYFARELMRLSGSSTLIWLTAYRNKWVAHKANALASSMVPLTPKKSGLEHSLFPDLKKMFTLSKCLMAFSTWFIGKKLTCMPKLNVDTRIVIVGASRTAMAFLNALIFSDSSTYLTFTSVTLISPNGLPYVRNTNTLAESMFPKFRTNSEKYLKSVPYTYYVNVVHDKLVEINKMEKYITLFNGSKQYYDLLFLTFGKQYQHPDYMLPILEREQQIKMGNMPSYTRLDVPRYIETIPQVADYDTPDNVFIINNASEAHRALNYVKNLLLMNEFPVKVIVYGATIHTYCCLNTLIELNVPPEDIIFLEPFPPADPTAPRVPLFCNTYVDQTLKEVIDNMQFTVYRSYYFESWRVNNEDKITHVEFLSYFNMINLRCSALFYYGTQGVDPHAFVAIHKSGMGYDGGILIDHQFRTKDPAIYAAGPATRYYRRYFADTKRHKYYDTYEIGTKLGTQIRDQLDPLFVAKNRPSNKKVSLLKRVSFKSMGKAVDDTPESKDKRFSQDSSGKTLEWKLPDLTKPVVWHVTLPGGLQYLEVRSPGVKIPHYYIQNLAFNGTVMETYKGGYFKLHMNKDLIIDSITCLSPTKYSLEHFKNIYGKSSVVLNNVHLRYAAKRIDDFYEFFRAPWAIFLYHEQLDELLAMTKELIPKNTEQKETIDQALHAVGDRFSYMSAREDKLKSLIHSNFEKSPHFEAIADYVIEWLTENDVLLPMYLQPGMNIEFMFDLDRNPAFRKRKKNLAKMLSKIC